MRSYEKSYIFGTSACISLPMASALSILRYLRSHSRVFPALLFCATAFTFVAHASSINISGQGTGLIGVNKGLDNPSSGQEVLYHEIAGAISSTDIYTKSEMFLDASPGILRAGVATFAGNPNPLRFASQSPSGSFSLSASDLVFLSGAPGTGFLSLGAKMEGSTRLDALSNNGVGQPKIADARWNLDFSIGNNRMLMIRDEANIGGAIEATAGEDISRIGTLLIPYNGTSLQVFQSIVGSYACTAGRLESCSSTGFFENTFQLGDAVVLDSAGNLVHGVSITSQTGYDYTQQLSLAAVPEPATWLPMSVALGILLYRRRR